jgi:ferritin
MLSNSVLVRKSVFSSRGCGNNLDVAHRGTFVCPHFARHFSSTTLQYQSTTFKCAGNFIFNSNAAKSSRLLQNLVSKSAFGFASQRSFSIFGKIKSAIFGKKEEEEKPEVPQIQPPPEPKKETSQRFEDYLKQEKAGSQQKEEIKQYTKSAEDRDANTLKFLIECSKQGKFDFTDYRKMLDQSLNEGGLRAKAVKLLPESITSSEATSEMKKLVENCIKIIDAMTPEEKANPNIFLRHAGKIKLRIAQSTGIQNVEINQMILGFTNVKLVFDYLCHLKSKGKPYPPTLSEASSALQYNIDVVDPEFLSFIKSKARERMKIRH